MFDPKKYDDDNSKDNKPKKLFSEKIEDIIKYLNGVRPLISKECQSMEDYINSHPNSKAEGPFNEKIKGWSKILIGLDIVKEKYEVVQV